MYDIPPGKMMGSPYPGQHCNSPSQGGVYDVPQSTQMDPRTQGVYDIPPSTQRVCLRPLKLHRETLPTLRPHIEGL